MTTWAKRARRLGTCLAALCFVAVVSGCASPSYRAPVEDRTSSSARRDAAPVVSASSAAMPAATAPVTGTSEVPAPLPGAENAGKPGYYTVRPGDTLIRVGLETGQNWRDLVRWNNLPNPNVVEVGQVLRVIPPEEDPGVASVRVVAPPKVETRALDAGKVPAPNGAPGVRVAAAPSTVAPSPSPASPSTAANAAPAPLVTPTPAPIATAPPAASVGPSTRQAPTDSDAELGWLWPANGEVVKSFDEGRSNGLTIAGKAGDPVLAAADGRIVYAGSGLRGYGNLVIVKHNATYLTAYAHNQTLLVKDDQPVRRGQKIAEMGSTDTDRVQLHFEIRKQGKPIDPAKLLPPR
jgi:lipoprotein NlpD